MTSAKHEVRAVATIAGNDSQKPGSLYFSMGSGLLFYQVANFFRHIGVLSFVSALIYSAVFLRPEIDRVLKQGYIKTCVAEHMF